jgi:LysM repeat protein
MKKRSMKGWALIGTVVALHVAVVCSPVFLQGCGTPQPVSTEPPPAPVMPSPVIPSAAVPSVKAPILIPPAPESPAMPGTAIGPRETAAAEHVIKSGESLSKVAAHYGLTTRELAELNGIKDANKIRIGQKLTIPSHSGAAVAKKDPKVSAARKTAAGTEYVVKSGDSLSRIAVQHGVKVADLKEANGLGSDAIRVGQKLVLPAGAVKKPAAAVKEPKKDPAPAPAPIPEPMPAPAPAIPEPAPAPVPALEVAPMPAPQPAAVEAAPVTPSAPPAPAPTLGSTGQPIKYPVSAGETVESIAKAFLVNPASILKLNKLADATQVKPGMILLIPLAD